MGSPGSAVTGGQAMQASYSEVLGGEGGGVLHVFGEVRTGLRKKEGRRRSSRDVALSKYFSSERSAVQEEGWGGAAYKLRRQIKKFD